MHLKRLFLFSLCTTWDVNKKYKGYPWTPFLRGKGIKNKVCADDLACSAHGNGLETYIIDNWLSLQDHAVSPSYLYHGCRRLMWMLLFISFPQPRKIRQWQGVFLDND